MGKREIARYEQFLFFPHNVSFYSCLVSMCQNEYLCSKGLSQFQKCVQINIIAISMASRNVTLLLEMNVGLETIKPGQNCKQWGSLSLVGKLFNQQFTSPHSLVVDRST